MLANKSCALIRMSTRHPSCNQRSLATKAHASDRVLLGDSDLNVSVLCLGTMTFGKQNTEKEAHEQLSYTVDQGVNFLAEMYPVPTEASTQGATDRYIGTWLQSQKRDSLIVASKVCGYSERTTWVRDPPQTTRVNKDQVLESVDKSLKRLKTEYLDLLQIHWPDRYVPLFGASSYDIKNERKGDISFEEQLRALEEVVKAGKVRYIGVSNETSYGVAEFVHQAKLAGLPKIVSIQNSYSLLVRTQYETDLAEICSKHNVGLLAYSPLAGGSLSNKYNDGTAQTGSRFNLFPGYMGRYNASLVKTAVSEYSALAKKHGLTPSELALAWCKSRWFVASTIIGATTMQQLKENFGAFEKELSNECVEDVNTIYKKYRDPTLS
ncbi:hypothetical protein CEUSTIGMA_g7427.t1 [Chlamydomonas eustigma]|uniref:NADP-dependent oxidoreductase domain-containing protein n=1 Tax=Chlamydomonas eustigma TaxID=1157962 RepID=A0A250XA85_9CHLO|nr:hypothetical protein CEUSTIGMA_g7427.t1 [Chlamydomonas eustigma]|eukprot:GAX79988.1 hypothetical protein CEUSTIGMA_g7427.t1 [Chlamydomonas eustigma]